MYEITVKWPSGETATVGGFNEKQLEPTAEFLWVSGADDVIIRCTCNNCETCYDRAIFES